MLPIPLVVYLIPPIFWVLYLAWLLLKRPSDDELVFGPFEYNGTGLMARAKTLETATGLEHTKTLRRVRNVVARIENSGLQMSQEALHEAIDEAYLELYFGGFSNRWAPWKKMGWQLKTVFWTSVAAGWFYGYSMVYYLRYIGRDFSWEQVGEAFWYSFLSLPLMLMLAFALNGCLYLLIMLLGIALPDNCALERAGVVLEEAFKTLRTGKRHEKIIEE